MNTLAYTTSLFNMHSRTSHPVTLCLTPDWSAPQALYGQLGQSSTPYHAPFPLKPFLMLEQLWSVGTPDIKGKVGGREEMGREEGKRERGREVGSEVEKERVREENESE